MKIDSPHSRIYYLAIIFWAGFAALVYQMYSVRVLFMFFVESTYAVAIAISAFLAGLALSSLVFSRRTRHNTRNLPLIRGMLLAAGVYGYAMLTNYQWIPLWLDHLHSMVASPLLMTTAKYAVMSVYLFFPAFFLGGAFPLINGLYLDAPERSSHDTGTVYFWDTLGAIAGALVAGFILLPELGIRPTVTIAACINLLTAAALAPRKLHAYAIAGIVCAIAATETYHALHNEEQRFTVTKAGNIVPAVDMDDRFGTVLFQKESPFGRVTVGQMARKKMANNKMLFINYRPMCTTFSDSEPQLAETALRQVSPGSRVLNIGLGCGFTASELAFHPNTKHLDIVEINPVIPEATRFFSKENNNVLEAPHTNLHIMNGADWLRNSKKNSYDVIAIDIEEVTVIYSSPLFTREYFEILRHRLTPRGVFALWSFRVNPEFTKVMLNTLRSVFPYVTPQYYEDVAVNYYAAMHPLNDIATFPDGPTKELENFAQAVESLDNHEINTLEKRTLEKYYNSNENFGLPDYYRENFVRP